MKLSFADLLARTRQTLAESAAVLQRAEVSRQQTDASIRASREYLDDRHGDGEGADADARLTHESEVPTEGGRDADD